MVTNETGSNPFGTLAEIMIYSEYIGMALFVGVAFLLSCLVPGWPYRRLRAIIGVLSLLVAGGLYLSLSASLSG